MYTLCVAASCFGVGNAVTFTTSRLIYSAAREHHLPAIFGTVNAKTSAPIPALLLHGFLTSAYLLMASFSKLVVFNEMVELNWYLVRKPPPLKININVLQLTVLGVLVLRRREPELERYPSKGAMSAKTRPYKTNSLFPILFSCASFFLLVTGLFSYPFEASFAVIFIAAGTPIYYLFIAGWRKIPGLGILPTI
jgi:amino acid transporter